MSNSAKVEIYGSQTCGFCSAARLLLKKKGLNYTDIVVSRDGDAFDAMVARTGSSSVPQIFIDDQPIGGFDDLYALEKSGELDKILGTD